MGRWGGKIREVARSGTRAPRPDQDLGLIARHRPLVDAMISAVFAPAGRDFIHIAAFVPFRLLNVYATAFERDLLGPDGRLNGHVNVDERTVVTVHELSVGARSRARVRSRAAPSARAQRAGRRSERHFKLRVLSGFCRRARARQCPSAGRARASPGRPPRPGRPDRSAARRSVRDLEEARRGPRRGCDGPGGAVLPEARPHPPASPSRRAHRSRALQDEAARPSSAAGDMSLRAWPPGQGDRVLVPEPRGEPRAHAPASSRTPRTITTAEFARAVAATKRVGPARSRPVIVDDLAACASRRRTIEGAGPARPRRART